ncbi:MAG: O-antigen ligase family protein [Bryobacteraceae bacterium]
MAALVVLSVAWMIAVWQSGGVSDFDRSVMLVLTGLAALFSGASRSTRNASLPPERGAAIAAGALVVWIAVSLIPLPLSTIEALSPGRAAVVKAAARVVPGMLPAPLTFTPHATVSLLSGALAALATVLVIRCVVWTRPGPVAAIIPIGIVAVGEAALGLAQSMVGTENPAGTFVNRNHYAALLAVSLPFFAAPAAQFVQQQFGRESDFVGSVKASLLVFASGLLLVAILFSQSRGANVAAVWALATIAALLAVRRLNGAGSWIVRTAVAAVTVCAFAVLAPPSLVQRFAEDRPGDATSGDRVQFWKETVSLVHDYPVFGTGLGGYESALQPYRRSALLWRVDFAHNDYLQLVGELGIPGAIPLAVIGAIVLGRVHRAGKRQRDDEKFYLAVACAGSWAAILVVALTDFNTYIPANAMLFAWVAGVSLGLTGERRIRAR